MSEQPSIPEAKVEEPASSGNLIGTRAIKTVSELAREYTKEAVEALARILEDNMATPDVKLTAALELLNRGWGKAATRPDYGELTGFNIGPNGAQSNGNHTAGIDHSNGSSSVLKVPLV